MAYEFTTAAAYLNNYYTAAPEWLKEAAIAADLGHRALRLAFQVEAESDDPGDDGVREVLVRLAESDDDDALEDFAFSLSNSMELLDCLG